MTKQLLSMVDMTEKLVDEYKDDIRNFYCDTSKEIFDKILSYPEEMQCNIVFAVWVSLFCDIFGYHLSPFGDQSDHSLKTIISMIHDAFKFYESNGPR